MTPRADCILDARARLGEAALWSQTEQRLWWADISAGRLNRFDPASGTNESWDFPCPLGCFALRSRGGLVLALANGWHGFDPATGETAFWSDPEPDRPGNRFNDGTTDPAGRFWAGTMPIEGARERAEGALYRLDADRRTTRVMDGFYVQNGLAFSPDGRVMYVSDSHPDIRTVWAYDYDIDTGTPTGKRVFFDTRQVRGRPDGGTVDADGCYWMAGVSGWQLVRITPDGRVDRTIDMPVEKPTKIAFGGRDLRTLFVTSIGENITPGTEERQPQAGGIFALDVGIPGLPNTPFWG